MTCCRETAEHAVDALERIEAAEDLWATLASVASGFGFDHVLACKVGDLEEGASAVVHATVPRDFVEALERHAFAALVEDLLRAGRPVLASERPTPPLTPDQRRLIEYARQNLGAADVLLLPIQSRDELQGVVALTGARPTVPPVVRSSLHLLAHIAFTGAADAKPLRKSALSPREGECLRLAAQGNTDAAIGRLLSISPRTARFHIENAKKKLGVTTRTQAVAEALRLNAFAA